MKKFMKVCAILALVFLTVGTAMVVFVGAIKGPVVLSQLGSYLQELDYGEYLNFDVNISFDPNFTVFQGNTEQSFSAEEVRDLCVDAGACQLVIEQSEDEEFHVKVEGAGKYQGYVRGNTLYIKAAGNTRLFGGNDAGRICLSVPEQLSFEQVNLSLGAGQISGTADLQTENIEIELGAGEITLSKLTAEKLDAEVGMGSLTVKGDIQQKADVECAMGSIQMTLAGSKSDYNFQVESAAGEVSIGGQSFGGVAGEWGISNDAPRDINVECAMGSILITFTD